MVISSNVLINFRYFQNCIRSNLTKFNILKLFKDAFKIYDNHDNTIQSNQIFKNTSFANSASIWIKFLKPLFFSGLHTKFGFPHYSPYCVWHNEPKLKQFYLKKVWDMPAFLNKKNTGPKLNFHGCLAVSHKSKNSKIIAVKRLFLK